jgi:hypothetical protein
LFGFFIWPTPYQYGLKTEETWPKGWKQQTIYRVNRFTGSVEYLHPRKDPMPECKSGNAPISNSSRTMPTAFESASKKDKDELKADLDKFDEMFGSEETRRKP